MPEPLAPSTDCRDLPPRGRSVRPPGMETGRGRGASAQGPPPRSSDPSVERGARGRSTPLRDRAAPQSSPKERPIESSPDGFLLRVSGERAQRGRRSAGRTRRQHNRPITASARNANWPNCAQGGESARVTGAHTRMSTGCAQPCPPQLWMESRARRANARERQAQVVACSAAARASAGFRPASMHAGCARTSAGSGAGSPTTRARILEDARVLVPRDEALNQREHALTAEQRKAWPEQMLAARRADRR